jgi:hypothetical protein
MSRAGVDELNESGWVAEWSKAAVLKTAVRNSEAQDDERLADSTESNVAFCVALLSKRDPALAKIIARWPSLPEPIKRAMLALIG